MAPGDEGKARDLYKITSRLEPADFPKLLQTLSEAGGKEADRWRGEVLAYWLEHDFRSARAYITSLAIKELKNWLLWRAVDTWVQLDPPDLMAWLHELSPAARSELGIDRGYGLAMAMAPVDPRAALEILSLIPGDGATLASAKYIFRDWAKRDPTMAAAQALLLPAGRSRTESVDAVVEVWSASDPEGARAWLAGISDPQLREKAVEAHSRALMEKDPRAGLDLLVANGAPDFAKSEAFSSGLETWARRDSTESFAWARALPDSRLRSLALGHVLAGLSPAEPRRAANWCLAAIADGLAPHLDSVSDRITSELSKAEGLAAAAAFVARLPEAEQRRAIGGSAWIIAGQRGALAFAEEAMQLPPSPLRRGWLEHAVGELASYGRLPQAGEFLQRLPAGEERIALTRKVAVKALERDPDCA
ncbi:MAG: hypothetical protein M3463_16570, partial [Verrucomicrobiota bacterium]|nr:hypothetical protein [Verrucomicrobiota bacterium]